MATEYQKRMMVRKTSDLTRLADQYKKNIEAMTGQYETDFANYQKQRDELMAPYEAAVKKYQEVDMPAFENAKSSYEQRLNQFNESLSNFQERTKITPSKVEIGIEPFSFQPFQIFYVGGQKIDTRKLPKEYSLEPAKSGNIFFDLYKDNPVPTFNEKAPTAPAAPTKPDIAGFDSTKFEQAKTQLQTDFQRDVGARKDARLAAVGRKASRPLLQGA